MWGLRLVTHMLFGLASVWTDQTTAVLNRSQIMSLLGNQLLGLSCFNLTYYNFQSYNDQVPRL